MKSPTSRQQWRACIVVFAGVGVPKILDETAGEGVTSSEILAGDPGETELGLENDGVRRDLEYKLHDLGVLGLSGGESFGVGTVIRAPEYTTRGETLTEGQRRLRGKSRKSPCNEPKSLRGRLPMVIRKSIGEVQ
ncbi:hypothetical protein HDU90_006335 [Geranomyces variabilis]|nr:hypothetical protein HDU90_006335 [Geranomyces variabilis]